MSIATSASESVWRRVLIERANELCGEEGGGRVESLGKESDVEDESSKFLIRDAKGRPVAVVLGSPAIDPDKTKKAVETAQAVREAIGPRLGRHVPTPCFQGCHQGLSYAATSYLRPLSTSRVLRKLQTITLTPALFAWLRGVAAASVVDPDVASDAEVETALIGLVDEPAVGRGVREAAKIALDRLATGAWKARRVAMHGDLWMGNVLLRPAWRPGVSRGSARFSLIDWGGGRVDGFPFWDLIRLAQSCRASRSSLAAEIEAHARVVGCDPADAASHLAVALGVLSQNLGCFPFDRFVALADETMQIMGEALAVLDGRASRRSSAPG